ncbi:hypothetical protein HWN77_26870, partial [Escherichia coli]|uniref:hypothetical protein n=1 Tax=Escherichia coli TaxID=562 RepID=UPI00179B6660
YSLRTFAGGPNVREAQPGELVDSGLEAEALLLLGEVYLKMHKFNDARESFTVLLHDYPRSPLVVQAN